MTRKGEAGLFDSIFLADVLGQWNDVRATPFNWLEPITTLAAVATATQRIGLIATASTTYTEPYNLARQFASFDHISRGRIGWNIVTTWSHQAGVLHREKPRTRMPDLAFAASRATRGCRCP